MQTVKMNFGFSVVNSGQRRVETEPQLVAVSTPGSFRITPQVSKALGVQNGDYVMFVNNIDNINEAIEKQDETLVAFCEANGLEYGSEEARIAIHNEFDAWGIAKGILLYDEKGNARTISERLTKKDKIAYVKAHFEEMLTSIMNDNSEKNAELREALSQDDITEEVQVSLLTKIVEGEELPKYRGSKLANPAGLIGTGVSLNFTDSNVWNQLKADMGDEMESKNRVFDIDTENYVEDDIFNGYTTVKCKILMLGQSVDKEPNRIGKKSEE